MSTRLLLRLACAVAVAAAIGGCGATTGASSSTPQASAVAPATTSPRAPHHRSRRVQRGRRPGCPNSGSVLAGVYSPDRLRVIDPCRHVTGTVISTRAEEDGDLHFDLRLDQADANMLVANNYSEQHGALVVELMPRDHGHLPPASPGDRVSLTGAYVDDQAHGWSEIHPVWALAINGGPVYRSGPQFGGSPPYAHSASALTTCRTSGGQVCEQYGAIQPATSTTSSSTTTGSSQVVHPGAFCAPQGARGVTVRGTPMTCTSTSTDPRARWRHSG